MRIYLDYHATTPLHSAVIESMQPYLQDHFGNPSSQHAWGTRAAMAVTKARSQVAKLLHAPTESLIFTSGATESIHLAIVGWLLAQPNPSACHIITTRIEHKATFGACQLCEKFSAKISYVDVDKEGLIKLDHLQSLIQPGQPTLVSVIHGNNEIGTVQPLETISLELKKNPNVFVHADAAQSIGKVDIDLQKIPVDFLSISGHKIYGPKGIGALFVRDHSSIRPLFAGGGQEFNLRAGTHNVPAIVGLGKACEWILQNAPVERERLLKLQKDFFQKISEIKSLVQINGSLESRLPNNINLSLLKAKIENVLEEFETVATSSGSACNSSPSNSSHVLKAIGVPDEISKNSLRIGLGLSSTEEKMQWFTDHLIQLIKKHSH